MRSWPRALFLALGMAALVLVMSGSAGLTVGQRVWFAGLSALLGLLCAWLIGLE